MTAPLRYGSVCSGIEAASVAWHALGWRPQWFSEIEPFPSAVLASRWPAVPNLGDFTEIHDAPAIDLLVGGTPCQSFSVAGLRGGLADDRGNLALEFLRLAQRTRARWVVWENVPGVFSSTEGEDFRCFISGLVGWDVPRPTGGWQNSGIANAAPGGWNYGVAWRVLDAQFFGVPQRRRRVFVVGYLGDWRPAAAVLFERASLSGDPPPSRKTREEVAGPPGSSSSGSGWRGDLDSNGAYIPDLSPALKARDFKGPSSDGDGDGDGAPLIAHSLRADGFDASEDGTGRGTPLVPAFLHVNKGRPNGRQSTHDEMVSVKDHVPTLATDGHARSAVVQPSVMTLAVRGRAEGRELEIREDGIANALLTPNGGRDGIGVGAVCAFSAKDHGADAGEVAPTLRAGGHSKSHANGGVMPAVAFHENQRAELTTSDTAGALKSGGGKPGQGYPAALSGATVRRLTPKECERLQGFPDDYTLIPWRGRESPDGPRYKALGNSMAVPVMRWIGRRIQTVEALLANVRGLK